MSNTLNIIAEENRLAQQLGLTYGQYKALQYKGQEQSQSSPLKVAEKEPEKPKKQLSPEEIAQRQAFGKRLAQARKDIWLSRIQLARQLNVTKDAVYHWEIGLSRPRERNLQKLRQIFGEELGL